MADLSNLHVLVTRPQHMLPSLQQLITAAGGTSFGFPAIEIVALPAEQIAEQFDQLDGVTMAIFLSANAVRFSAEHLPALLAAGVQFAAIGEATARALSEHNVVDVLVAPAPQTTESLLTLPALQNVSGKKILIVSGVEGRRLIYNALQTRGAVLSKIAVYCRQCPTANIQPLLDEWQSKPFDLMLVTSGQGLENMLHLLKAQTSRLQQLPLVVMSERIAQLATDFGFKVPSTVVRTASDIGIITALQHWKDTNKQ